MAVSDWTPEKIASERATVASATAEPAFKPDILHIARGYLSSLDKIEHLQGELTRATSYNGSDARPCPLCWYENGELRGRCAMHAEIDRLNKWADGFSDAQLKERAAGEAYQAELRSEIERLQALVAARRQQVEELTARDLWLTERNVRLRALLWRILAIEPTEPTSGGLTDPETGDPALFDEIRAALGDT